jgi:hypothetical protein
VRDPLTRVAALAERPRPPCRSEGGIDVVLQQPQALRRRRAEPDDARATEAAHLTERQRHRRVQRGNDARDVDDARQVRLLDACRAEAEVWAMRWCVRQPDAGRPNEVANRHDRRIGRRVERGTHDGGDSPRSRRLVPIRHRR